MALSVIVQAMVEGTNAESKVVRYEERDGVAVLTVDHPPVNALSAAVAHGLALAMRRASTSEVVRAIVIAGAGRTFIAGADIAVLQHMAWGRGPGFPRLHALLQQIEDSGKPVVMAMHGTVLGGGLELAMAGHYRLADAAAQAGQPEVNLGIIPGAEGTQRLPRLVGMQKAIEMCVTGMSLKADEALACGLIDAIVAGELLAEAVAFAKKAVPSLKTRERDVHPANAEKVGELLKQGAELAAKTRRNQMAPMRALDALHAAAMLPFDEGCDREWELFNECIASSQARAMMHAFFAERASAKLTGVLKSTAPKAIGRVGIVGAGTMGAGIAMVFANAGIPVILRDANGEALDRGLASIRQNYETSRKRGRFSADEVTQRLGSINTLLTLDGFEAVDLVIEAVFENMALKKEIFAEIDKVIRPDCILASNTSTLDIDALASVTSRPERVLGLHFFSPANLMRLLEIVRGKATSADVVSTAMALAKQLQKVGVVVGNCPGFVGNRLFFPYMYEAQFLVEEGATPQQVDSALTEFGMAMGIFGVDDLVGLDVAWRVRQELGHFAESGIRKPLVQDQLYALGRFGQKTGRGWYSYGDDRKATPDPEVLQMIERASQELGIERRIVSSTEITERCIYSLVNEGARVLEEGFAQRASDIDVIYLNGYGFPSWRGGPMCFADEVGLARVLTTIEGFYRTFGDRWKPAPLLVRLAAEGRAFREYDDERQV